MKKSVCALILCIFFLIPLVSQSKIVEKAPWAEEEPVKETRLLEIYLPLEFFGGNILNYGVGAAFLERKLDVQFQGGVSSYKWEDASYYTDDYQTWGFSLGGDITHHFLFREERLGAYYGLLYRYNHVDNMKYTALPDIHWAGLALGGELHGKRLTFYGESLWFLENFYLDLPHVTLTGGVKFWIY